jgi:hypothetical protein
MAGLGVQRLLRRSNDGPDVSQQEQKRNVIVKIRTKSGRAEFGTLIGQFLALFIRKVTEGLLDELEAEILNTVNHHTPYWSPAAFASSHHASAVPKSTRSNQEHHLHTATWHLQLNWPPEQGNW